MYYISSIIFLILIVVAEIKSKKLPEGIIRCKKTDPKFKECLANGLSKGMEFFSKGYPDLGIPVLEPFEISSLDLGDSNSGSVKLHQIYENLSLYGMAIGGIISNFESDFTGDNCGWRFDALTPVLRMESDYKITGQLLVFPINGHGRCNNSLYNMHVRHEMKCERYEKKGKKHLKIVSYTFDLKPERVVFYFDNMIDGNVELSKQVLNTINENALTVFSDVRNSFANAFSQIWLNVGNTVLSKVPEEDVFL